MKPLNTFNNKEEAINYYVDYDILTYDEAVNYVEKNWDKTRE